MLYFIASTSVRPKVNKPNFNFSFHHLSTPFHSIACKFMSILCRLLVNPQVVVMVAMFRFHSIEEIEEEDKGKDEKEEVEVSVVQVLPR